MPRRNLIWIPILLAMAAVLLLVWRQPRTPHTGGPGEFGPVERTYRMIRDHYYQPVKEDELQRAAVRGMVGELDEFSTYVPPEKAETLTDRVLGTGQDLGLEWTLEKGRLLVLGPRPDSPAHQARLFSGDRILAINDKDVQTLPPEQIRSFLSPPPGEDVELTVLDADNGETRTIHLKPEIYPIETVQGLYRDATGRWQYRLGDEDGMYYVRIPEFCTDTAQRLGNVLRRLGDLQGLVLDLRDNPGGPLADGVAVADLFLRDGPIVHVLGRNDKIQTHQAHSDTPYADIPLVMLIDEKTTSAAEIVAGALAANSRAVLLGQQTHGKGCVQTMIRLPGQLGQINLTTAEFRVPPDQPIQRRRNAKTWGIQPQVTPDLDEDQIAAIDRRLRTMRVLPRPVKTDKTASTTHPATRASSRKQAWKEDRQLKDAEELLRNPRGMDKLLQALTERNRLARESYVQKLQQQDDHAKKPDDEESK